MAAGEASAELEHFCGYGGKHLNTVRYHPIQAETLIYTAAAAIIIENVNDPHKQEFLRGHDNEVSALDVSQNGKLVASGQLGSPGRKGDLAPVVVWDFEKRQSFIEFSGLAHAVLCVKFSPDGRFLVATGADQTIYVWDVSTGEVVYHRRTESACYMVVWGAQSAGRYPSYELCTAYDSQVLVHTLSFDVSGMCYRLKSEAVQLPSSGLQRKHISGIVQDGFLVTGTTAGDMCVFNLASKVFRTSLPVCNNGVSSLAYSGEVLYAAGGDGRVKAFRGQDAHWDVLAENVLEGGIVALTASCDSAELVAGCRNGKLWRLLSSDLTATLQAATHTGEVTDIAFGTSSEAVATISAGGEVFYLDLSDYMPIMSACVKSAARSAVFTTTTGEILVGYDDGFVRAWPSQERGSAQRPRWELQAHRGGVTAVRENRDFIVTGGTDFAVRFWHRTTRELLTSFTNHRRPVADLHIDQATPHLVHSGSEDKLLVTYDFKQNRPLVTHSTQDSSITGLSQRKDGEREMVTTSLDGKLLFWDVDYADATACLECSPGLRLRCCEVSPSGRYIVAGADDARLYIYDLMSNTCIQVCEGHVGGVTHARWSPDQKQIVSAGRDGCVIVWNFFEVHP